MASPTLIDRLVLEDSGLSRVFLRVVRVLKRLGLTIILVETRSAAQAGELVEAPPGFGIEPLPPTDFDELTHQSELRVSSAFIAAATVRGDQCAVVRDEHGTIVAYGWSSTTAAPHDGDLEVVVPPGHSYGYKALTLDAHRGRNLFPLIIQTNSRRSLEQGFQRRLGFAELANQSSLRAMRRAEYQPQGLAGYLRVGARLFTFRTPALTQLGFRFRRAVDRGR